MAEQSEPVYHLEIRRFPRSMTRFNLSGSEVGAIVIPWVEDRVLELEEQKWSPHDATITILLGPPIPLEDRTLGRGWPAAQRESQDVTGRVLAEAREAVAGQGASAGSLPAAAAPGAEAGVDQLALGVELGALLGSDPLRLLAAWRAVAARTGGLTPSESLALAERELQAPEGAP